MENYLDVDIRPSWPAEQLYHLLSAANLARISQAGHYIWLKHSRALQEELLGFLHNVYA